MYRAKKHSALFLFSLLAFQMLVVWSHSFTHTQRINSMVASVVASSDDDTVVSEKEEKCAICDYHFSVTVLPSEQFIDASFDSSDFYIALHTQLFLSDSYSFSSPRAPPVWVA